MSYETKNTSKLCQVFKTLAGFTLKKISYKFGYTFFAIFYFLFPNSVLAQNSNKYLEIDKLLIQANYKETVEKCNQLLDSDSLDALAHFKLGLAFQNLLQNDKATKQFQIAFKLNPDNQKFAFILAKQYFSLGKVQLARSLFENLYRSDSTNWLYANYFTEIYVQKGKCDLALPIYQRFFKNDTTNCLYLDKIAYCYLKQGFTRRSIETYKKSLKIDGINIPTLKMLGFIYNKLNYNDTAVIVLTNALTIDSTETDLYTKRGDVYFSQNYHPRARNDYFKVLQTGDTSLIMLKKIGIGYAHGEFHKEALDFLSSAYKRDTSDWEICSYLGQAYNGLKQTEKSIFFYKKAIGLLSPGLRNIALNYHLMAGTYEDIGNLDKAIELYNRSLSFDYDPQVCLVVAYIYDEKLKNGASAMKYYQRFLENPKGKILNSPEYIGQITERMAWIKKNLKQNKL